MEIKVVAGKTPGKKANPFPPPSSPVYVTKVGVGVGKMIKEASRRNLLGGSHYTSYNKPPTLTHL